MKVYVDELPNSATEYGCDNCHYAEVLGVNHYIINGEFVSFRDCICKLDKTCGFRQGEKHCPLISLADHDNQVRKQVCDEIRKFYTNPVYDRENAHTEVRVLLTRLDQIEKGE